MAEALEGVIRKHLGRLQLPERCYSYVAGIILDDPPRNTSELLDLVGDFIRDGCELSEDEIKAQAKAIMEDVTSLGVTSHEPVSKLVAEMLPEPLSLRAVGYKDNEIIDPFLGIPKANVNFNQQRKGPKKKASKRPDEGETKVSEMKSLPPVRVYRSRGEGKERDIIVDRFTIIVAGKALLENAQLKLSWGHKYGLIGRNGIGKTTLLRALAAGEIEKQPKGMNILYVEQEVEPTNQTVIEALLETDVERTDLLERERIAEAADDADALQEIYAKLEEIEASSAEARAAGILAGLGFTESMITRPLMHLSGGWRRRVALARALYVKPDILLLDEPTNHLDLETVLWLENFLKGWTGTLVLVSHARDFLNQVITDVMHLSNQQLEYYRGNYDEFDQARSERILTLKRASAAQKKKVDHIQDFINRFRCNAKRAALVQSRIKSLNRMELVDDVLEDPMCSFLFMPPETVAPPLLRIDDGAFSYPDSEPLLKDINFGVDSNSRIALLGRNGEGKSTLLKLLIGSLELTTGTQQRNRRIRVSMFAQHQTDDLDLRLSALEHLSLTFANQTAENLRNHLGSFGLSGNLALLPMHLLSGGQKARVAFATAAFHQPHVMLLDEPTNHLDIDAVNALIMALHAFSVSFIQGGLVVVSHDMHFIQSLCEELWVIRGGRVKRFRGDAADYRRSLIRS
jgi:ATP-binding cassette subfamily F protein 3